MRLGKDWTLMLQPYLILCLEVFDEDWIRNLIESCQIMIIAVHCVCSVLDFDSEFNL